MKKDQKKVKKDSLGDRMKKYEGINRTFLIPKVHTVMRLDGKAFHTYTKKFKRPYDDVLINAMDETAKYLCSKIQGAKFAFVQSDEISIYLSDMDTLETSMWYDGNIQKMVSVSASMATSKFNHIMVLNEIKKAITSYNERENDPECHYKYKLDGLIEMDVEKMTMAEFDSRIFQLPNAEEVVNCILWRQQDATRNSIQAVAQSMFSTAEMHKKSCNMLQEMMFSQKQYNWDKLDPKLKRGRFIDKVTYVNGEKIIQSKHLAYVSTTEDKVRTVWESTECPVFNKDREFLLSRI